MNGREGWAPFSYLEPVNADNGRAGANSEASEASEEEDTLRVTETNITKYGKHTTSSPTHKVVKSTHPTKWLTCHLHAYTYVYSNLGEGPTCTVT